MDSQQQNFGGVETFTADSKFGMYFNFAGAAVVTNRFGMAHQISEDNTVFRFQATTGSVVAFADIRWSPARLATLSSSPRETCT